jgi:glutaredoxin 2
LINQLNKLKKTNEKIFNVSDKSISNTFMEVRKRTAERTGNPRFLKIHLHTFRHFKATTEYHKTKDIIHIEQALFNYTSDEWTSKIANTPEEACKLIEAGFTYINSMGEKAIFKKRK